MGTNDIPDKAVYAYWVFSSMIQVQRERTGNVQVNLRSLVMMEYS